jgi:lysophospholipase L1-like esterase
VAVNGGWGDGLLSYVKDPAKGENRGKSGSTTVSWKTNGRWDALIESIGSSVDDYEPIVTIQFGHNDQKTLTLGEFQSNLEGIATEIKEAGGTPVQLLCSSLCSIAMY